jgi:hypothetical protein
MGKLDYIGYLQDMVNEATLHDKGKLLKPKFQRLWSEENHLRGYCYLVSEWVWHYVPIADSLTPRMLYVGEETHWFLQSDENGDVIDLTAGQYNFPLDYTVATKRAFFKGAIQTNKGWISRNGHKFSKIDV